MCTLLSPRCLQSGSRLIWSRIISGIPFPASTVHWRAPSTVLPGFLSHKTWYLCAVRAIRMASTCGAFVGENTAAASEYHSNDFDWEDLRAEVEALTNEQQQSKENHSCNGLTAKPWIPDPRSWEKFHARDNATARFYKERRYLLLEFPSLANSAQPQHVLEIGCGCGSSLLPVLKANAAARVTATDLSPTAVRLFCDAAERAEIAADRYTAFPCDAADSEIGNLLLAGLEADSVLLIFTLAALCPEGQHVMLSNAFKALRHGGLLLIRDHGLYDITHLRMTPDRQLGKNLYRRGDGTLCYFFSTEDLASKAEAAGFEAVECKYVCVRLLNRKKQFEMRRVFVHGVFRKPLAQSNAQCKDAL